MTDSSVENTRIPEDQAARDKILSSLDSNLVIIAGAGAGKTTAIISRMIALVVEGMAEPGDLAAITFTRKAAGELRNRFLDELRQAAESADGERKRILQNALVKSDQAFAGTIHAFCGQLLRDRSFAVGLQPDFVEIDERRERLLLQRYWDDFLHFSELQGDDDLRRVQALNIGVGRLFQFFTEANEFRDIPLKQCERSEPDLDHVYESVRTFLNTIGAAIPSTWTDERDPLMKAYFKATNFLTNRRVTTNADKIEYISFLDGVDYKKIRPERWLDPILLEQLKKTDYKEFRDTVIRPAVTDWSEYVYATILPLVEKAVAYCSERRRLDGLVSFDDLLFYATKLLRESSEAREYFASKYRHLFVDEFQDTDPIQAELIFLLTAQDSTSSDWRTVRPRAGSLCIVGDEKQAIYRFRRADVETFRFATQRVVETGGGENRTNHEFSITRQFVRLE